MPSVQGSKVVKGLPELRTAMSELAPRLLKKAMSKGLRLAAVRVQKAAQAKAPVRQDGKVAGGALKRNITKRRTRIRNNRITYLVGVETGKVVLLKGRKLAVAGSKNGVLKVRKATRRERAGEDPFYYRFQELGFTAVGRGGKGAGGPWIEGKHYLQNAFDENVDEALADIELALNNELKVTGK